MDLLVGRMIYLLSFNSNPSSRFNFHIGHSIEVEIASVMFKENGSEVKLNSYKNTYNSITIKCENFQIDN